MSDLTKPDGGLTVEERLALLEARLGPAPQAVVPPITIGELTNVPAPGSQIAAAWAQSVSVRVVQRFANKSTLDSQYTTAVDGVFAVTIDKGIVYQRKAGAWCQFTPWTGSAVGVAMDGSAANVAQVISSLSIPADPANRIAQVSAFVRLDVYAANSAVVALNVNSVTVASAVIPHTITVATNGLNMDWNIALPASNILLPGGVAVPVTVTVTPDQSGAGVYHTFAAAQYNRVDATVFPKGY